MSYVVETNLLQRSFSDMAHSEKVAVIALHHSKMFSQGKRNDILEQIKILENPRGCAAAGTYAQVGHRLKSRDIVAKEYSLSRNTVARYLRIQHLVPGLKLKLDNGAIAFIPAVAVSFLKEDEQKMLLDCMDESGSNVDMKKANMLRQLSTQGKLDKDSMLKTLSGCASPPKPHKAPAIKLSKTVFAKYFKPTQSTKEIQKIIEKALEMYFKGS